MTDLMKEIRSQAVREQLPILRDAELPLLTRILGQVRPERLLEVGTCIGYSALIMAPFLKEKGTLTTIELDEGRYRAAKGYFARSPYDKIITSLQGDAAQWLTRLEGPWDFVFLDGPKGQYVRYLQLLMPRLAPGALIVADNLRYHDMIYIQGTLPHKHRTAVTRLRQFLSLIDDTRYFDSVFFENGDGLTVSRWKG